MVDVEPCDDGSHNHQWEYRETAARCGDVCGCDWDGFVCVVCDAVVTQLLDREGYDTLLREWKP